MSFYDIVRKRRCWPWFYTAVPAPSGFTPPSSDFTPAPAAADWLLIYEFPSGGSFLTNTGSKAGFNLSAADICGA